MGDNEDDFSVKVSDQTVSAPSAAIAPSEPEPADPPLQVDNLDNIALPAPVDTSSNVDQGAAAQPSDSDDFNVAISDDTAHAGYQPPVEPQVTMGPDNSSGAGDDRPEEQHDEERDDIREKIEQDSSREADPEPPSGE